VRLALICPTRGRSLIHQWRALGHRPDSRGPGQVAHSTRHVGNFLTDSACEDMPSRRRQPRRAGMKMARRGLSGAQVVIAAAALSPGTGLAGDAGFGF
jgi:hypothetical protein